jgi:outer membrane protein OmpA-like peptidoglycan-associated protein
MATAARDEISLRVDPAFVSPNDDDIQDKAFLYPVVQSQFPITRWRLDVFRAGDGRVARLTGAGIPALITWDGLGKKGIVPDGGYRARLEVWGKSTHLSGEAPFTVDTAAPAVSVALSSPAIDVSILSGRVLAVTPTVQDPSPIERWQCQILDDTGRTVQLFWSTGTVEAVRWDGTDRATGVLVPQGRYKIAYQAWDAAGNASQPAFADIDMQVTAKQMLEKALSYTQVTETGLGLVVQIPSEKLFIFKSGKIVLQDSAERYLREMALLANAYPRAGVSLEGYSKAYRTADKDRELASLYAWQVYSYLVKKGNVKASRITVRGRGRSATFHRREAGIDFLKNGVEMVIEGPGPW